MPFARHAALQIEVVERREAIGGKGGRRHHRATPEAQPTPRIPQEDDVRVDNLTWCRHVIATLGAKRAHARLVEHKRGALHGQGLRDEPCHVRRGRPGWNGQAGRQRLLVHRWATGHVHCLWRCWRSARRRRRGGEMCARGGACEHEGILECGDRHSAALGRRAARNAHESLEGARVLGLPRKPAVLVEHRPHVEELGVGARLERVDLEPREALRRDHHHITRRRVPSNLRSNLGWSCRLGRNCRDARRRRTQACERDGHLASGDSRQVALGIGPNDALAISKARRNALDHA